MPAAVEGAAAEPPAPGAGPGSAAGKRLRDAARRALAEAAARRAAAAGRDPHEHGGPAGPEPTRFGDWERKGVAVDF